MRNRKTWSCFLSHRAGDYPASQPHLLSTFLILLPVVWADDALSGVNGSYYPYNILEDLNDN